MDSEYLFKPIEDEKTRKKIAELPQRVYLCKNRQHYIWTTIKDDAVRCELCDKIYTYDDCEEINTKTYTPYQQQLSGQILLNKS